MPGNRYIDYLSDLVTHGYGIDKTYPTFLNYSVTNSCNARCVMCDIWKYKSNDLGMDEVRRFFANEYLKDIRDFGITGGEPFLRKDISRIIMSAVELLPSLRFVGITTNGFMTSRIRRTMPFMLTALGHTTNMVVTVSLDGLGSVHDISRGVSGVHAKVYQTIEYLKDVAREHEKFQLNLACTITTANANYDDLCNLQDFAEKNKIKIVYRLGVVVDRIYNRELIDGVGVRRSGKTAEVIKFLSKLQQDHPANFRNVYYKMMVDYLGGQVSQRPLSCKEQRDGFMLDSNGDVYVCSVSGQKIGNLLEDGASALIKAAKTGRNMVRKSRCPNCFHDHMSHIPIGAVLKSMVIKAT
jgi:MoaA/NifB/PqqE/SkfB family radical SAM enzyme